MVFNIQELHTYTNSLFILVFLHSPELTKPPHLQRPHIEYIKCARMYISGHLSYLQAGVYANPGCVIQAAK